MPKLKTKLENTTKKSTNNMFFYIEGYYYIQIASSLHDELALHLLNRDYSLKKSNIVYFGLRLEEGLSLEILDREDARELITDLHNIRHEIRS